MKPLLLAAALAVISASAMAQNTKGMPGQNQTSTTTNPGGSVGVATPSADNRTHADKPSGTTAPRMEATKRAQDDYEKKGKSGASLR